MYKADIYRKNNTCTSCVFNGFKYIWRFQSLSCMTFREKISNLQYTNRKFWSISLKICFLENYIFWQAKCLAHSTRAILYRFFMFIPEITCSLTVSNCLGRISFINLEYCLLWKKCKWSVRSFDYCRLYRCFACQGKDWFPYTRICGYGKLRLMRIQKLQ